MSINIFLDEAGDLGFDFTKEKTSRYLVIGILVCFDNLSHLSMLKAVKRTLKNKLSPQKEELKGSHSTLEVKKYFLKELKKGSDNWSVYTVIVNKKTWFNRYLSKHHKVPRKEILYDEMSKYLFSLLDYIETANSLNVTIDRSKNKSIEINAFNVAILSSIEKGFSPKTRIEIKHCDSKNEAGLQAVDLFCSGIRDKYEKNEFSWYSEFSEKIAIETEYKL